MLGLCLLLISCVQIYCQGPTKNLVSVNSITSRSISISWIAIQSDQPIIGYVVDFQQVDGDLSHSGMVTGLTYVANELTPYTNYTFRVAGVSRSGVEQFSDSITLSTRQDVPGVVSDFAVQVEFTSVSITWGPPREPNGIITNQRISYRINGRRLASRLLSKTAKMFITPQFPPNSNISNITVVAHTAVGAGPAATHPFVLIPRTPVPPSATNVRVEYHQSLTPSVKVVWDGVHVPGVAGYAIYYHSNTGSEETVSVPEHENSALITGLSSNTEYTFQVETVGSLDEQVYLGMRSSITPDSVITTPEQDIICEGCMTRTIGIVVAFIGFVIITCGPILVVGGRFAYLRYRTKKDDEKHDSTEVDDYDESLRGSGQPSIVTLTRV